MKSKKVIILAVTAAVIACSKPVCAQEVANTSNALTSTSTTTTAQSVTSKISKEQAKQMAKDALKDYFDITIDDSNSRINIDSRFRDGAGQAGKSSWDINFNIDDGDNHSGGLVSIDQSTGKIINFHSYTGDMSNNKPKVAAAITEDEAKATAEAFISKIAPEEFKSTKLVKNNQPKTLRNQNFSFSYNRLDNDIPVYGDCISAAVDAFTGKITSYSIQWTDKLDLPSKDGIIDEKKGSDLVSKNTKMNLAYITSRDALNSEIEKDTKLVYTDNSDASNIIDAKTGEVLNLDKFTGRKVKAKDITTQQKEDIYKNSQGTKRLDKTLTSDEAEEIAKEKLKVLFNGDFTISSAGYGERSSGLNSTRIKTWDFSFNIKGSNAINNNGNISINTSNGEIIDIYGFNQFSREDQEKFEPKLTSEQAYDKAIQIISNLYPEKIKDIKTEQNIIDSSNKTSNSYIQSNLGFNFQRLVNNLPYKYDGINLNFSTKTGELLNLNCTWEDSISAPTPSNAIDTDAAKKVFLSSNVPELMYILTPKDNSSQNAEKEAKLIYSINNLQGGYTYVDAITGKLLNYSGQELDDSLTNFQTAIKGSSVEKEASILASNGIIDTKDFKLDGNITNLQFIKILTNIKSLDPYNRNDNINLKISTSISKDSADYKYLQLAVNAGILDNSGEFKASDLVTREQASMYLVKLLQYNKVAKLKDAFNFQPSDKASISTDYIGYVSLAKALGLIDVDSNNNIRPKNNITMEEVVKAVYETLQ